MNNSVRIFRELKSITETLKSKYRPDDGVAIGLRYSDRAVDKVEGFFKDIQPLLFTIVDGQHQVSKEHKNAELLSVFVCDSSGQTIYDSKIYQPSKMKTNLKKDGDKRLLAFKGLNQEEKEQVINLTVEQIHSEIDGIGPDDDLSKLGEQSDSAWGEMPWDFQK